MAVAAALLLVLASASTQAQTGTACVYAKKVCAARASVFRISAYDPAASAVRIGENLLVTSRHAVADAREASIFAPDGTSYAGKVVPTAYRGDLILIEADLPPGPIIALDGDEDQGPWQTVGADVGAGDIRVYEPGRPLLIPAAEAPFAMIQHTAYSQPGNSGGALVDGDGELVGIVTAGGEGRSEALPARAIADLKASSGQGNERESERIGVALKSCDFALDKARGVRGALPAPLADTLQESCTASGNRLQLELAAQAFGQRGALDVSAALYEQALALDPGGINTRLGYLTTLHLAGRFADEVPIVRSLLALIPQDPTLHRYAVQAGKWGGDPALAEEGVRLVERYNPAQAGAARRFLEADLPPPHRAPKLK